VLDHVRGRPHSRPKALACPRRPCAFKDRLRGAERLPNAGEQARQSEPEPDVAERLACDRVGDVRAEGGVRLGAQRGPRVRSVTRHVRLERQDRVARELTTAQELPDFLHRV
jgi:hypothetical protein